MHTLRFTRALCRGAGTMAPIAGSTAHVPRGGINRGGCSQRRLVPIPAEPQHNYIAAAAPGTWARGKEGYHQQRLCGLLVRAFWIQANGEKVVVGHKMRWKVFLAPCWRSDHSGATSPPASDRTPLRRREAHPSTSSPQEPPD